MRVFFIIVLVLNLLIESLAAASLILGPQGAFAEVRTGDGTWSMIYGFAAFAIATAIIWIWPNRNDNKAVGSVMGMLVTFHTALFIALAIAGTQNVGMIIHGVMAVFCLVLLTQRSKWCT